MARTEFLKVTELCIDLKNFRTVPQSEEIDAVKALISIKAEYFWGLTENLIDDGYYSTENILVIETEGKFEVKEGNRRIGALKIIHGILKSDEFNIPANIQEKITNISKEWLEQNSKVPCAIYGQDEINTVDKIVSLTHGKGEKASRSPWTSVARARHNRDMNKSSEPSLDLLEKYLKEGNNLTRQQKEEWAADYPLTVMDAAIGKTIERLGATDRIQLSLTYPKLTLRVQLESMLRAIGLNELTFTIIRNEQKDFALDYGFPAIIATPNPASTNNPAPGANASQTGATQGSQGTGSNPATGNNTNPQTGSSPQQNPPTNSTAGQAANAAAPTAATPTVPTRPKAYALNDPKSVIKKLKSFSPKGPNRDKVVTLRDECLKLDLTRTPIAFCFLLRSLFEISAKEYCKEHGLQTVKSDGNDRSLVDLLRDATNRITTNNSNKEMMKLITGGLNELNTPGRILSVTSMNQLVHNTTFSIQPADISTLFNNMFPLLEALN